MGRQVIFQIILAEYGQALAAARRYQELRYGAARRCGLAPADIPQRIFAEFYARRNDAGDAAIGWHRPAEAQPGLTVIP
ncbi:MAG TPA: hypothetical protein VFA23_02905 [Dongiaceae bacterium]|nr:hypothetical protein [Dongiaceae bacterium]